MRGRKGAGPSVIFFVVRMRGGKGAHAHHEEKYGWLARLFKGIDDLLSIKFNIDGLDDCNPDSDSLKCDVSELFSWVSSCYTYYFTV